MTGFLASVKDINEATIASTIDIDILDLKNINDGALGFVGIELISKVKNLLPNNIISVTMGNDINPNNSVNIKNLKMVAEKEINSMPTKPSAPSLIFFKSRISISIVEAIAASVISFTLARNPVMLFYTFFLKFLNFIFYPFPGFRFSWSCSFFNSYFEIFYFL